MMIEIGWKLFAVLMCFGLSALVWASRYDNCDCEEEEEEDKVPDVWPERENR